MKTYRNIFLIITLFVVIIFTIKKISKKNSCNKVVVITTGKKIKCQWINSYNSGFSNIRTCDGKDIQVYTTNIDSVTIE